MMKLIASKKKKMTVEWSKMQDSRRQSWKAYQDRPVKKASG